ncbi:MAG: hypothetical protein ABWZ83_10780, partial [Mesorhizobium sp.]
FASGRSQNHASHKAQQAASQAGNLLTIHQNTQIPNPINPQNKTPTKSDGVCQRSEGPAPPGLFICRAAGQN